MSDATSDHRRLKSSGRLASVSAEPRQLFVPPKRRSASVEMEDMGKPVVIIAAGGTGGHMFPAQALAERMLSKGWQVKLSTDARGARYTGGFAEDVEITVVSSATFSRGGLYDRVTVPFKIFGGVIASSLRMVRNPPEVVVGFGGYPSIPAVTAAWLFRIPTMIHEQNGVLGKVNQLFVKRVTAVACGTWPTELPPNVGSYRVGNPVRAAVLEHENAPYAPPGDHPMHILVMGGSQGARVLSDVVPEAIAKIPEPMRKHISVSHQARPEDHDRVTQAYAEAGIEADVQPFFDDVPQRMARSQLVISRAGASSVADISVIGRPSILIPLASAIRNEQEANARGLVEAGGAIMLTEKELSVDVLTTEIEGVLSHPGIAREMASRAYGEATPDATDRLTALVEELAGAH